MKQGLHRLKAGGRMLLSILLGTGVFYVSVVCALEQFATQTESAAVANTASGPHHSSDSDTAANPNAGHADRSGSQEDDCCCASWNAILVGQEVLVAQPHGSLPAPVTFAATGSLADLDHVPFIPRFSSVSPERVKPPIGILCRDAYGTRAPPAQS